MFLMSSNYEIKYQVMITKLKFTKNSRQSKKIKRIFQTEPINCTEMEQQQQAIKAKNYLMNLNKDEDAQLYHFLLKQKSQVDISLSQWNHSKMQDNKMSERVAVSFDIDRLKSSKRCSQQLCPFEIELIERECRRNPITMRNTNLSQFSKRVTSKKFSHSPQQKNKSKMQSSISDSFEVGLPKPQKAVSFSVKCQRFLRNEGPPKIDISYKEKPKNGLSSPKRKDIYVENKSRLPRLDLIQSQNYKNKYKSVFKHEARKQTLSLPTHSLISKDINKIYDLIREESIKIIKKAF